MISRDTVIWGYRLILGREPESDAAIDYHCRSENLLQFRKVLLESEEFSKLCPRPAGQTTEIPFPAWNDMDSRVVFMHSPKTGGTTLHHLLLRKYSEEVVCPERFNGLKNHAVGMLAKYQFFSGHYDLVSCQLIPGEKQIVTFLREPVSRLVSLYNFLKAHRPDVTARNNWKLAQLASDLSADEFFRHPCVIAHPYIDNGMTRALVASLPIEVWPVVDTNLPLPDVSGAGKQALHQLSALTAFGVLEHYEDSVNLIFDSLGFDRPESIESKMVLSDLIAGDGNYRAVKVTEESPKLRSIIEELVPADIELYSGAIDLFNQRLHLV